MPVLIAGFRKMKWNNRRNNRFFGLTFSDYPEDIANSLERADVYYRRDEISQTFYIKSRNVEDPLTELEKGRISAYLGIRGFPMRIVFEN